MHPRTIIYAVLMGAAAACLRCFSRCQELSPSLNCKSLCGCAGHFAGLDTKSFQTEDGDVYRVAGQCDSSCKEMCFSLSTGWGLHQCLGYCRCELASGDEDTALPEPEPSVPEPSIPSVPALSVPSVPSQQPLTQRADYRSEEPTPTAFLVDSEEAAAPTPPSQKQSPVLSQEEACYQNCQETCLNLPPDCIETCSDKFCGGYRPVATSSIGFSGLLTIGVVVGVGVYSVLRRQAKSRRPKASVLAKLR